MGNALSIRKEQQVGAVRFELSGQITEDSDFQPVLADGVPMMAIDLAAVSRINSTGVREWINFMNALTKAGTRVSLERCSVAIVQQLNMIANFAGKAAIKSVFAPYVCGTCDHELAVLLDFAATPKPDLSLTLPCPSCKGEMELDDLPETYLSFRNV